jgi:hypothetical protein
MKVLCEQFPAGDLPGIRRYLHQGLLHPLASQRGERLGRLPGVTSHVNRAGMPLVRL